MASWSTPHEPWTFDLKSTYTAAKEWAQAALGRGDERTLLVIGSPPPEAIMLAKAGWRVTYLDWRIPPRLAGIRDVRQGDACALPFADDTYDALSSTCVICHVGMGRYGDPLSDDTAPFRMLSECLRVVKPGGRVVMTVGPVAEVPATLDPHRVFSQAQIQDWCNTLGAVMQQWDVHEGYGRLVL